MRDQAENGYCQLFHWFLSVELTVIAVNFCP